MTLGTSSREWIRVQGRIIEMRFFGGLSIEETAPALGVSPATVKRDWAAARAWLYREMARTTHLGRPSDGHQ